MPKVDFGNKGIGGSRELLVSNIVAQYGLQIAKYVIPFITLPYLARVLGGDGYGIRSYVLSVMTIATTVLDFGFMTSATKSISRTRNNIGRASLVVGAVVEAKLLLVLIVGIALVPISMAIPLLSENQSYFAIAYASCAINSLVPDYVFMGYERMSIMTIRYVVCKAVGLVLTFAFIHSPSDLLLVPIIDVVSSIMAVVWTYYGMKRQFGIGVKFPSLSQGVDEFKRSSEVFVANFSTTLFNSYTTLVIGVVFGAVDVAYWSLASTVVSSVQSLYSPIFNSLYVYMISQLDISYYKKIFIKGALAAVGIAFITAIFSRPIMWVLGGDSYLDGAGIIAFTSPVIALSFCTIGLGWPLLGAFGFESGVMKSSLIAGLFTVIAVSGAALLGIQSLAIYAVIRCASEAVLAIARGVVAVSHRREIKARGEKTNAK